MIESYQENPRFKDFVRLLHNKKAGSLALWDPEWNEYDYEREPAQGVEVKIIYNYSVPSADDENLTGFVDRGLLQWGTEIIGFELDHDSWSGESITIYSVEEIFPNMYVKKGAKVDKPMLVVNV